MNYYKKKYYQKAI